MKHLNANPMTATLPSSQTDPRRFPMRLTPLILALLPGPLVAQLATYDAGTAGQPPVAPDPVTQGWTFVDPSGGLVTAGDLSPDGSTGLNAWFIDDQVTFNGGRAHHAALFTPQNLQDAFVKGWSLTMRMRMLSSSGLDNFYEYATGTTSSDDRYLLFFEVQGTDILANALLTGQTFLCTGGHDGAYHTYTLTKAPGALDASFEFDGASMGTVSRAGANVHAPDGGVHWGSGSSGATMRAHYNFVQFRIGPVNGVTYCTGKLNSSGCVPAISFSGTPSASSTGAFDIGASGLVNNKTALFFFGLSGRHSLSFQGGVLCALPPLRRTMTQGTGGNPPPADCSGTATLDFNQWMQKGHGANVLPVGTQVQGQFWYLDPADPVGVGLSDAIEFTVEP